MNVPVLHNAYRTREGGIDFITGNAYKTHRSTDYVSFNAIDGVNGLEALDSATKASIHWWINVDPTVKRQHIGSMKSGSSRFGFFSYSSNIIYVDVINGEISYGTANFEPHFGAKTLVSVVFDGTQTGDANRLKLYINEVLQPLTFIGPIPASLPVDVSGNFRLNSFAEINQFGKALYGKNAITNDASTASQISKFYNGGKGEFPQKCFTNIISSIDTNQEDGETEMPALIGTAIGTLNNSPSDSFEEFNP